MEFTFYVFWFGQHIFCKNYLQIPNLFVTLPLKRIMTRKRKPLPMLENVTIEAVAAEGKCVAHVNEMAVFVPFVVPGDIVDLQVKKKK